MIKALKEIGLKKAYRFGFYTIMLIFFKLMIFPQLRKLFLQLCGAKIGKNTIVHQIKFFNVYYNGFKNLEIGENCFIGDDCLFDVCNPIILENDVTIGERVTILTHTNVGFKDHPLQEHFPRICKPVILKQGSFVGACAIILPGVTINQLALVGAGSMVTKDVKENSVVVGNPAKKIKIIKNVRINDRFFGATH